MDKNLKKSKTDCNCAFGKRISLTFFQIWFFFFSLGVISNSHEAVILPFTRNFSSSMAYRDS